MRSLIAEDDPISRRMLQWILNRFGDCDIVDTGIKALDKYVKYMGTPEAYDLICLDIMMPEMDGLAVLREIRRREDNFGHIDSRKTKIVMTTALNDSETVLSAVQNQCNGYLVKPIDRKKLIDLLIAFSLIKGEK